MQKYVKLDNTEEIAGSQYNLKRQFLINFI